jgi:hypothetical protein
VTAESLLPMVTQGWGSNWAEAGVAIEIAAAEMERIAAKEVILGKRFIGVAPRYRSKSLASIDDDQLILSLGRLSYFFQNFLVVVNV